VRRTHRPAFDSPRDAGTVALVLFIASLTAPLPAAASLHDQLLADAEEVITTPAGQQAGSKLTLQKLMDIVERSDGYEDYLRTLTSKYRVDNSGSFFALHADRTVKPTSPQVFITIGKATIAYAPQIYTEVFWSQGEETIHFQLMEKTDANGKRRLAINDSRFNRAATSGGTAAIIPTPEFELTPKQVKAMHMPELIKKTNDYAKKGCGGCHINSRRRMVEPDNHGRRFNADPNWKFRDEKNRAVVMSKLDGLFQQFANGPTKKSKIYRWFWEQPQVVARGGQIRPEDTFSYEGFVKNMIAFNGREMLGELKRDPAWHEYREAFAAAVLEVDALDKTLKGKHGFTEASLADERSRIERLHAEVNLKHILKRNDETIAWIMAEGQHDEVKKHENSSMLLLNRHAVETIGPRILDLLVSEAEYATLSPQQRLTRVRLSDIAVKDLAELREIVQSPRVVQKVRRRTNTHLVLEHMFRKSAPSTKMAQTMALSYLSSSVLSLSAETGREGADLLDVYKGALLKPARSAINRYQAVVLEGAPGKMKITVASSRPERVLRNLRQDVRGVVHKVAGKLGFGPTPAVRAAPARLGK
jgi:hypothetical protein